MGISRARLLAAAALVLPAACTTPSAPNGALRLSNYNFDQAYVQVVATSGYCEPHAPGVVGVDAFPLPFNASRFMRPPAGVDICWRRALDPVHPRLSQWSPWSRAYLVPGAIIDSRL